MARQFYLFDRPRRFVAGTVGVPGGRTFYLQAVDGVRVVSVSLEKQQVSILADRIEQLLDEVVARTGTEVAVSAHRDSDALEQPVDEEFRVGAMGLAWDSDAELVVIEAQAPAPGLDDDQLGIAVPGQAHCADAKLLVDRLLERIAVAVRRCRNLGAGPRHHLVEQLLDAVGQDGYLLLFQRDRNHPHAIDGLQVKRAFARHANGPRDESTRAIKLVELAGHSAIQPIRREYAPQRTKYDDRVCIAQCSQYRLGSPAEGRFRPLRRRGAGARAVRSPPMSLLRTTSGRAAPYRIADTEHGSTAMR